jgi:hypothetical protein
LPLSGRLHLIAADTKATALNGTGVPIETVIRVMQESRCRQRVLILDCCHSGAVGAEFRGGKLSDSLGDLARNTGTWILTASTAIQTAEERESTDSADGPGHGVFTRYFIDGLEKGEAPTSSDGETITIDGIYDYVYRNAVLKSVQQPQRFLLDGTGAIEIGRSIAVKREKRRNEVRNKFHKFLEENTISDEHYIDVLRLSGRKWSELGGLDRDACRKLLDVLDGRFSVAAFYGWLAAARKSGEEMHAGGGPEHAQVRAQQPKQQPPTFERPPELTSGSAPANAPTERARSSVVKVGIFFAKTCFWLIGIYCIVRTPAVLGDRYAADGAKIIISLIAFSTIVIAARRVYTWRVIRRRSV